MSVLLALSALLVVVSGIPTFESAETGYTPPSQTYGPPPQTYGPPQCTHGKLICLMIKIRAQKIENKAILKGLVDGKLQKFKPEPSYHKPEPSYHEPEPSYHEPEPSYQAPEPSYQAPEPSYKNPVQGTTAGFQSGERGQTLRGQAGRFRANFDDSRGQGSTEVDFGGGASFQDDGFGDNGFGDDGFGDDGFGDDRFGNFRDDRGFGNSGEIILTRGGRLQFISFNDDRDFVNSRETIIRVRRQRQRNSGERHQRGTVRRGGGNSGERNDVIRTSRRVSRPARGGVRTRRHNSGERGVFRPSRLISQRQAASRNSGEVGSSFIMIRGGNQ